MKMILFLPILLLLTVTACATTDSLQDKTNCNELGKFNEDANNGLFLLDSNIKKPTVATATIIGEPLVSFDDIKRVKIYPDENTELDIHFTIDFDTGLQLSEITQSHISEYMALVVNDTVVTVTQIQAALGGSFRLGGFASNEEVKDIHSKISCKIQERF